MNDKRLVAPVANANASRESAFTEIRVPGGAIRTVDKEVLQRALEHANAALTEVSKARSR